MSRNPALTKPRKPTKAVLPKGLKPAAVNPKQLGALQQDDFTGSGGVHSTVQGQPILKGITKQS